MVKRNILLLLCLVMALTVSAKPKKVQTPAVSVGELRTEHMVNPMSGHLYPSSGLADCLHTE